MSKLSIAATFSKCFPNLPALNPSRQDYLPSNNGIRHLESDFLIIIDCFNKAIGPHNKIKSYIQKRIQDLVSQASNSSVIAHIHQQRQGSCYRTLAQTRRQQSLISNLTSLLLA